MKSQITGHFNDRLSLMERAYRELTHDQFEELEDKIRKEITFHRRDSQASTGKKND